jgi:transglutaminase-like putative cysteine protease
VRGEIVFVSDDASLFLGNDDLVQSAHPAVRRLATELRAEHSADVDFARAAFDWVRDNVGHSYDGQDSRVTLAAGEVLRERVGLCYAKSVLLAALLRSQGVPAGLCYQRLGNPHEGFVVHGLVALWLDGAWHRQDPRGNKMGIDAQFSLDVERLAFPIDESVGECDYPRLYASPAPEVVQALRGADDILTTPLPSSLTL